MDDVAVNVENLSKKYGETIAVDNISFSVKEGEIFGFLGPNGAGKTTIIRMLLGLLDSTNGSISIGIASDYDIYNHSGYIPEQGGLYEYLTPVEYLDLFGRLFKLPETLRRTRINELLELFLLQDKSDSKISTLSKGMRRKLSIARALIHDPEILFLDEPTEGLDPEMAVIVRDLIASLTRDLKKTFIICTHNLREAEELCNRIAVIKKGSIIYQGNIEGLKTRAFPDHRYTFKLVEITPEVQRAIAELGYVAEIEAESISIVLNTIDPSVENPRIIDAIRDVNGQIISIEEDRNLEDAYLKIMEEN